MTTRTHHLQEERLLDCYFADRGGEAIDPPVAEHLADCDECGARYSEVTEFLDRLRLEADADSDAVFTPEHLRAQQIHLTRRLDHVGRPARVINFPGQLGASRAPRSTPPSLRRWVAAAGAAGVFAGVATGVFFEWEASRAARSPGSIARARPAHTKPVATRGTTPPPRASDDAFLWEVAVAAERPRTRELQALDALTPYVREISNQIR